MCEIVALPGQFQPQIRQLWKTKKYKLVPLNRWLKEW